MRHGAQALYAVLLSLLPATPILAQADGGTPATATVRVGCAAPAPPGSLVPQVQDPPVYLPNEDGLIVIEVESTPPTGSWVEETALPGFTGDSYYRWNGPDLFGVPGVGVLSYTVQVEQGGTHQVRIHNRHDHPDPSLENDCWIRVDGGPWDKFFNNEGPASVGIWAFLGKLDSTSIKPSYFLGAGQHVIELSGRSFNFKIDRIHVFPGSAPGGEVPFIPPSELGGDTPVVGTTFTVEMDDPTNAAQLTPGMSFASWFANAPAPGAPCGLVIPGLGALGGAGELLIDFGAVGIAGPTVWNGPGSPAVHAVDIPLDATLVGKTAPTQGLFTDLAPGAPSPLVLTDGLDLFLGDV